MANDDIALAIAHLDAERFAEAEVLCRRVLMHSPYSIHATNCLGVTLGRLGRYEEAVAVLQPLAEARSDVVGISMNFGIALRGARFFAEAERWLRKALALDPKSVGVYINLGAVLADLGRNAEAIVAFREAVALDPTRAEARHMIAALEGKTPDSPSPDYVRGLFNDYADRFESDLVGTLDYRVPQALRAIVGSGPFHRALDLGCGTGLVGVAFKDCTAEIVGIDLAERMIAEARKKNIYTSLHALDILDYFASDDERARPFDLIVAADVFIYVGKLDHVFAPARAHMVPGGCFAFSVEECATGTFALQPSGRYAHSRAYIEDLARAHGFTVVASDTVSIRKHREGAADGLIFVLRRTR